MANVVLYNFGQKGVNVDASDLHMDDAELRQAQNAIHDPLGNEGGIRTRPGLEAFNDTAAAGAILGGIGVPIQNQASGVNFLFIGRGPSS